MSAAPAWIQTLQALLTPVIAFAVGIIAYMQWKTAHEKVMLDLFERRLRVVERVREFQGLMEQKGLRQDMIDLVKFHQVRHDAQFLFGPEVVDYLRKLHETAIDMSSNAASAESDDREERRESISNAMSKLKVIIRMSAELTDLCAPYLQMDQKRILTPMQWFRKRNHERLSYADEHQQ